MIDIAKKHELEGHNGAIYSLDIIDDFLISAGFDNVVGKWEISDMSKNHALAKLPSKVISLLFIESKQLLAVGTISGGVHIIDLIKNVEFMFIKNHDDMIFNLTYDEIRNELIIGSGDGIISIYDLESKIQRNRINLNSKKVRKILIYELNYIVACGDGSIKVIDIITLETKRVLRDHLEDFSVNCLKINNSILYSGSRDGHLNLYSLTDEYKLIDRIPAHNFAIYDIVFSPDEKYFATASRDKSIKIWSTEHTQVEIKLDYKSFKGHSASINKLLWNEKGLFSAGDDRKIILWDISY